MTVVSNVMDNPSAFWVVNSLFVFALSVFCAGVLISQILLISFRKRLFDVPDERKIHQGVVPRLGGIAFKPVVFFSVALALGLNMLLGYGQLLGNIGSESRPLAFGFCTIMMLYLVGMADDLIGIRYRAKFAIQIICGLYWSLQAGCGSITCTVCCLFTLFLNGLDTPLPYSPWYLLSMPSI